MRICNCDIKRNTKIGKLVKDYIPSIFQYCEQSDITEIQR